MALFTHNNSTNLVLHYLNSKAITKYAPKYIALYNILCKCILPILYKYLDEFVSAKILTRCFFVRIQYIYALLTYLTIIKFKVLKWVVNIFAVLLYCKSLYCANTLCIKARIRTLWSNPGQIKTLFIMTYSDSITSFTNTK